MTDWVGPYDLRSSTTNARHSRNDSARQPAATGTCVAVRPDAKRKQALHLARCRVRLARRPLVARAHRRVRRAPLAVPRGALSRPDPPALPISSNNRFRQAAGFCNHSVATAWSRAVADVRARELHSAAYCAALRCVPSASNVEIGRILACECACARVGCSMPPSRPISHRFICPQTFGENFCGEKSRGARGARAAAPPQALLDAHTRTVCTRAWAVRALRH